MHGKQTQIAIIIKFRVVVEIFTNIVKFMYEKFYHCQKIDIGLLLIQELHLNFVIFINFDALYQIV